MTHTMNNTEKLWELWRKLCDIREEIGRRRTAQGKTWRGDDSMDYDTYERLWSEYDVLSREFDIAAARAEVVWARYVVAKHGLDESDVFDVE